MTAGGWGWGARAEADSGRLRWVQPLVAAAPWVTLGVLLLMLHLVGGTLAAARGVLFDLPEGEGAEGTETSLVALVLPSAHETMVFFDDARYRLGDAQSVAAFGEQLRERAAKRGERTLLVLADRRVGLGDLADLAAAARGAGVSRLLFAEKRVEGGGQEE